MQDMRDIDILEGTFYTQDPYSTYAWMRDNAPVYWDSTNEIFGISRYDDIVEIEKAKHIFISSHAEKGYRPNIGADKSIIGLDDPEHTTRRVLVSRRFTPRNVKEWEPHIRSTVVQLIESALEKGGTIEAVNELAAPLPAMMIGHLLGFADELWPKLQEWSERTIALGGGPRYHDEDGITAVFEFTAACMELYEAKKATPTSDVMSAWVAAEEEGLRDGQPFSIDQIVSDCLLLLDGGAETTRTVIARTLLNLIERPDQWAKLKAGADLDIAVEEFIRFVTPIHNMCRTAVEPYELNGTTIQPDQQVVLMYSSANRDPQHFENPEELDVTRTPNHHIAFGFGTHFCLGASLARLEIRIFFEELLRRVETISSAGEPVEMPNAFVFGLRQAPIHLTRTTV